MSMRTPGPFPANPSARHGRAGRPAVALAMGALLLSPALAQAADVGTGDCTQEQTPRLRGGTARLENDLFTGTDQNYTGFSRDTCKNAPYNLFSLVDSFGCRIFLGASSVSAIGSQLRQQLLQRGHTHVGPQRLGLCLFATLPLLR